MCAPNPSPALSSCRSFSFNGKGAGAPNGQAGFAAPRGAGFAEPPERTLLGRSRRGYAQGVRKHCKKPCEHVGLTTPHAFTHFTNHSPTPPICPRPEECICIPLLRRKLGPRRRLCNTALLCNLRPFACFCYLFRPVVPLLHCVGRLWPGRPNWMSAGVVPH